MNILFRSMCLTTLIGLGNAPMLWSQSSLEAKRDILARIESLNSVPMDIVCPPAEFAVYYEIKAKTTEIPVAGLPFTGKFEFDSSILHRLSFCVSPLGSAALYQLDFGTLPSGNFSAETKRITILTPEPAEIWPNILGGGSLVQLDQRFIDKNSPETAIVLKGWANEGDEFLTVSPSLANLSDTLFVPPLTYRFDPGFEYPNIISFGSLRSGDPFATGGERSLVYQSILGEDFELILKYEILGSHQQFSLAYEFQSIEIKDSKNPDRIITLFGKEADNSVEILYSHHGFKDGFTIILPSGTYSLKPSDDKYIIKAELPQQEARATILNCESISSCGTHLQEDIVH